MNCVFNKITKKFTGEAMRWDMPPTSESEVVIVLPDVPSDMVRLDDEMTGARLATQTEIDADISAQLDIDADIETKFDPTLKAFALAVLSELNILRTAAGLPTRTIQQLKDAVKAKL